jgi:Pyruvate/2-oxoacid:ferredoxin oxidoreductase delta subunit
MSEKIWQRVASNFVNAGGAAVPVKDILIEVLQTLMSEDQAKFLLIFKKRSLNIDEIKANTDLNDETLDKMLSDLMDNGLIIGIPSRRTGIMVYSLVSILPGLLEYPFMRGKKGEKQKKLAKLMDKLFDELRSLTQDNYDVIVEQFRGGTPMDRVVPVEKELEINQEIVLPYEDVKGIIARNDIISVNYCYCRNWKDNLNEPCKLESPDLSCFQFGRYANFLIEHNFGKAISKNDALKIVEEAEDHGLIHKAIHMKNPEQEEDAFCNCCNCCCQLFQLYKRGIYPFHTLTYYISITDEKKCIGCGTCVEKCPIEAIELKNAFSVTDLNRCFGCGLCAHHCPEKARNLKRTGLREVFIPPPQMDLIN